MYKQNTFTSIDERNHLLNRTQFTLSHNRFTKTDELKRNHEKYSHIEYLSSDEFQLNSNEISGGGGVGAFADSLKQYERFKKTRRQKHYDLYANGERDKCRAHGKRRCCDTYICENDNDKRNEKRRRNKRSRTGRMNRSKDNTHTYDVSSSDDDCIEVTNRDVLKVALNIKEVDTDELGRSTLSHKLNAFRSKSSDRNELNRIAKKRVRRSSCENENVRKRTLSEEDRVNVSNDSMNENDDDDDEDTVSLEEQELRLIALKSAVLKKHEARKQRKIALSARPYSPTDSMLTPTGDDNVEQQNGLNEIEHEDNNNMDISSASSPQSNQCQPMDMELASDDSKSPIFFDAKNITYPPAETWNWMYIQSEPVTANNCFVDEPYMKFMIAEPLPIDIMPPINTISTAVPIEKDDESELRAQLIATMKSTKPVSLENISKIEESASNSNESDEPPKKSQEEINQDQESLEADCLRSLLLSSIRQKKKPKIEIDLVNDEETNKSCDEPLSIPKITSNLKEAVRRIQQNELFNAKNSKLVVPKDENETEIKITENNNKENTDKEKQILSDAPSPINDKIIKPIPVKLKENHSIESTSSNQLTVPVLTNQMKFKTNSIPNVPTTSTKKLNHVLITKSISPQTSNSMKLTASLPSKLDLVKKSSAKISDWQPVKKLIITLNGSESSTSEFDNSDADDATTSDVVTDKQCNEPSKTDAIREFDNASPASILMDSPSFSPYDGELSQTSAVQSPKDNQNSDETKENTTERPKTDAFQMKLDEYLKTVRAKTETEIKMEQNTSETIIKTTSSTTKTTISLKPKTSNVSRSKHFSSFH